MTIENYLNTDGVEMVLIIDEENDKAESMTKAEYDRRQVEHLTEIIPGE